MGTEVAVEAGGGRVSLHVLRRLRRRPGVIAAGIVFLVLVAAACAAPLYAKWVAHTGPYQNHISETVVVDGHKEEVVSVEGVPIGPTWQGRFLLGADRNGRDTMVRLLYGARNSLLIGFGATVLTLVLATFLGLVSGYFGGLLDAVISRAFDVLWAFPVVLLGIALGVALSLGGVSLGFVTISGNSLWIPIIIIGISYVVYLGRPIRGRVLALRDREFIDAARIQGRPPLKIIATELLPNIVPTLLVFLPLIVANAILLEAALSFLGAGVRPPESSWGVMISEGVEFMTTAPALAIAPGLMLVLTVLSLNVLGEALREAIDPRSEVRMEH